MDRREATIGACGLLAALMLGDARAYGQAAQTPAKARQAPAQPAAKAQPPIDVETLLKNWEGQSSKLKTLDVGIERRDDIPEFDEVEYYEGRALFKNPNMAFIDFKKIKQDAAGQRVKKADGTWDSVSDERIICTGQEVWQYRSDTRQIFIYPLEKDQAAKAIEEGPLPFLFNMKAEEAKQRYEIKVMAARDDKTYDISIKPKLAVDQESFSHAFVQLDRAYMLPVRILLISPNGKGKKDFKLGPVKANGPVNEDNFVGKVFGKEWKVVRNPAGEERPKNAPAAAGERAPAAAARPAPAAAQPRR